MKRKDLCTFSTVSSWSKGPAGLGLTQPLSECSQWSPGSPSRSRPLGAAGGGSSRWRPGLSPWLWALAWPSPGCLGYVGRGPARERSLPVSPSLLNQMWQRYPHVLRWWEDATGSSCCFFIASGFELFHNLNKNIGSVR